MLYVLINKLRLHRLKLLANPSLHQPKLTPQLRNNLLSNRLLFSTSTLLLRLWLLMLPNEQQFREHLVGV